MDINPQYFIAFIFSVNFVFGWDLYHLDIKDFTVNHVLIYNSRAIISIASTNKKKEIPSLIEVPFPENTKTKAKAILNSPIFGADDCDYVVRSVSTNIDQQGRLWILDNGSRNCSPKILVYNLGYRFYRLRYQSLKLYENRTFSSILIDPKVAVNGDVKAFISLKNEDFLLVYSLLGEKIAKLEFS